MNEIATTNGRPARQYSRLLLVFGVLAAVMGPVVYAVQFANNILISPWYVAALATLGVVLIAMSLFQRRTVWRIATLGMVALYAALVWLMFLVGLAAPPYTGSVEVGRAFPNFETKLASGAAFGQMDLKGDQNTILLFFRGRW